MTTNEPNLQQEVYARTEVLLSQIEKITWNQISNDALYDLHNNKEYKDNKVILEVDNPMLVNGYDCDLMVHSTAPLMVSNCKGLILPEAEKLFQISDHTGDIDGIILGTGLIKTVNGDISLSLLPYSDLYIVNHTGSINGEPYRGITKYTRHPSIHYQTLVIYNCNGDINFKYEK